MTSRRNLVDVRVSRHNMGDVISERLLRTARLVVGSGDAAAALG